VTAPSLVRTLLAPGALRTALQPIVALDDGTPRTVAYECLTRGPRGSNLEQAQVLFDYVRLKHDEPSVDRACVASALRSARCDAATSLSLNVHAATLGRDGGFVSFLLNAARDSGIAPRQLIVEIVEYAPVWNEPVLHSVAALRDAGVRIAVDDIGLGHSNLRMILDVRPELFKIDRYFVDGCHADPRRVAVIASVCQLARSFGAVTIAEGIEEACDVAPLVDCGVTLFQGYFFGRPVIVDNVLAPSLADPQQMQ